MKTANRWKIFGIGLGRTGTKSLTHALEILGFRTKHLPHFYLDEHSVLRIEWSEFESHDALTDENVALVFKEADCLYPGSKFILTIRDLEDWLDSRRRISEAMQTSWDQNPAVAALHTSIYGTPRFDPLIYENAHKKHIKTVKEYFRNRPEDLLIMNICAGDGWAELCQFLDKPVPDCDFPRSNVFNQMA